MKKIFTLLLALCMVFSLTACAQIEAQKDLAEAGDKLADVQENGDISEITDAMDDYADKAENAGATTDMSAEEIVELLKDDPSVKSEFESLEAQGLTCKLEARNNSLVYIYQYTVDIGDANTIKAGLDAQKDTYKSLADSNLKIFTGIDDIIFEFLDKNGNVITSYTFS